MDQTHAPKSGGRHRPAGRTLPSLRHYHCFIPCGQTNLGYVNCGVNLKVRNVVAWQTFFSNSSQEERKGVESIAIKILKYKNNKKLHVHGKSTCRELSVHLTERQQALGTQM